MADIRTLLEMLVELQGSGKKLEIGVANAQEYETLRTALTKLWGIRKTIIRAVSPDDSDPALLFGLCSSFSKLDSTDTAQFWIGIPRKRTAKSYSFLVVEEPATGSLPAITVSLNDELPTNAAIIIDNSTSS